MHKTAKMKYNGWNEICKFIHKFAFSLTSVRISSGEGGSTSPSPGTYQYVHGTHVTVTANPHSGYTFDYWLLNGQNVGAQNPITVTMNNDHNLQAIFTSAPPPQLYWLTVETKDCGTGYNVYANIYIDDNWVGWGYASIQVTAGWHSILVDDWANGYIFSYFDDNYGNGASRPIYSDTWITAYYYPS